MSLKGDVVENWRDFEAAWNDYLLATQLNERLTDADGDRSVAGCTQVAATLCTIMGAECKKVMISLPNLSAEDKRNPDRIIEALREHFVPQRNVVYERFMFNNAFQKEETADEFILRLRQLAESCEYGDLKDSLIRDRIIAGTSDQAAKERLLRERPIPDLNRAIEHLKASEVSRQQNQVFCGAPTINYVSRKSDNKRQKRKPPVKYHKQQPCSRCGAPDKHSRDSCPAKTAKCHKCKKKGHYSKLCRSGKKSAEEIESGTEDGESGEESYMFMGEIEVDELNTPLHDFWSANVYVNGQHTSFKLDSGSKICVVGEKEKWTKLGKLEKTTSKFRGAGGVTLDHVILGVIRNAELKFADRIHREDIYVMRNQQKNLLSKSAVQSLKLLRPDPEVYSVENSPDFRKEYPELFHGLGKMKTAYKISLREDAAPMCLFAPRRVPHPLVEKVKQQLGKMEKSKIITRVTEPTEWCSGMVVVPKANGTVRICVDLTALNKAVKREVHPMASVDENLAKIQGSSIFTKLDANSGFWQIPLDESSRLLTTFVTSEGRYCFNRLPFGISSAPEIFQRIMSNTLEGLEGVICHMDDILIHAKTQEDHDKRVRLVLNRLREAGMTLNEKCTFSKKKMTFLGHIISGEGIEADPQKTKAIREFPTPTNVTELQRFNGMVNQLAKFIPNLAEVNEPLRQLLKKENEWIWSEPQELAFGKIKKMLIGTEVLAHYNRDARCIVAADASQYGIGAVLLQEDSCGKRRPISYASRSLSDTEKRYAVIEKEALASTWACEKFKDFVLGAKFRLETDHRPLIPLLSSTDFSKLPSRILRFRLRLMKYSPEVVYVQGVEQKTADALSRAPIEKPSREEEVQIEEMESVKDHIISQLPATTRRMEIIKEAQKEDTVCSQIKTYVENGWPPIRPNQPLLKPYFDNAAHFTVANDLLMYDTRIVIPQPLRMEILDDIHQGHLGITKCKGRAYDSVWWPNITAQVETMCRSCTTCALHQDEPKENLMALSTPDEIWERVGTDLFHHNYKDYIVIVDYGSKWLDMKELKNTTSGEIIKALSDVFATHGTPKVVVSDNGPQYASSEFTRFALEWGFSHVTSSPRYPRANGEAERAVRTAKKILQKNVNYHLGLLAYRSAPLHNGFTPSQLLMSRRLRTTIPTIPEKLTPQLVDLQKVKQKEDLYKNQYTKHHDLRTRTYKLPYLSPGDKVYIRDQGQYGEVKEKVKSPRSYNIATETGSILRRNRTALIHTGTTSAPQSMPGSSAAFGIPSVSTSSPKSVTSTNQASPGQSKVVSRSGRIIKSTKRDDMIYL